MGISIAARGLLSPVICAILMPLSSVTVVACACGLTAWHGRRLDVAASPRKEPAMIVIFLLIPLSIVTAAIFLVGFIWAVRSGQYEDTCTPSLRPLMDDRTQRKTRKQKNDERSSSQPTTAAAARTRGTVETFKYDNRIVRAFAIATVIWGIVGMTAGLLCAIELFFPAANLDFQFITFGRLRPVHTNAVIFAFVGNGMFMGIYYSLQRLCKARMFSDKLSWLNFWGWNAIIVAAAITLPLGFTTSKEYAELEWPIKIAIAVVWVAFTINLLGTIVKRREKHIYVAIWFYIATALTVAILHIVNGLEVPVTHVEGLLDLRRRAGCAGAMVVRPQRGGLLPDHALPRA